MCVPTNIFVGLLGFLRNMQISFTKCLINMRSTSATWSPLRLGHDQGETRACEHF